jgi:Protein of unknown function (DUF1460)
VKHAEASGLERRRVKRHIAEAKRDLSIESRIDFFSRYFLGRPYKSNPLIGAAGTPEVFTASIDGFDCVTYIETVLAIACAAGVDDFIKRLRKIRYDRGRIRWEWRNHYMTGWIRNNVREGVIRPVSMRAVPIVIRERLLNIVAGLKPQRIRMKCVPKRAVPRLERYLQTGDLIFFGSTRKHLDVFHAGIIVRDGSKVSMRHASRSRGRVVEQDLSEFVKANRMAGVIVVRPREVARRFAVGS